MAQHICLQLCIVEFHPTECFFFFLSCWFLLISNLSICTLENCVHMRQPVSRNATEVVTPDYIWQHYYHQPTLHFFKSK